MKAIDYIKQHSEIVYWNIYRRHHGDSKIEWVPVDTAEIEEDEMVEDAFMDHRGVSCELYLTWD